MLEGPITNPVLAMTSDEVRQVIVDTLDDAKAEDIVTIDLRGKSDIADFMVIASGRSDRHVGTLAEHVHVSLKEAGHPDVSLEGMERRDWVLVDSIHVIVHLFRPEIRQFYRLEDMWDVPALEVSTSTRDQSASVGVHV